MVARFPSADAGVGRYTLNKYLGAGDGRGERYLLNEYHPGEVEEMLLTPELPGKLKAHL